MTPQLQLLLLSISSSVLLLLLHPAASLCVPRNTSTSNIFYIPHASDPAPKTPAPSPPPPHPSTTDKTMSTDGDADGDGDSVTAATKSICGIVPHPGICMTSVELLVPSAGGKIDTRSMLTLQAKALRTRTVSAQALAKKLAKDPKTDKVSASGYDSAVEFLGQALDNIDQGLEALKTGDMGTAHSMFDALCTNYDDTENEFMDWEKPSALEDDLSDFVQTSSNILEFLHLLK